MTQADGIMKTIDARRFVQSFLKQKLGDEYKPATKREVARMRGHFVQTVSLGVSRSEWMTVYPTFYVVGADPSDEVMFQTMSLPMSGIDSSRRWSVQPETLLDEILADRLVRQIEEETPLSFLLPLTDASIHKTLQKFCKGAQHWAPSLSLTYWEILTGNKTAADTLAISKKQFIKHSRFGSGKQPLDFEHTLMARYELLQARIGSPDCIGQCRAEAEVHAAKLKLPKIHWPQEWPE